MRNTCRPQVCCTACGGTGTTSGKIAVKMSSAQRCRTRSHTTDMCHVPNKNRYKLTLFVYIVVVLTTPQVGAHNKPNDNREKPRSIPNDLRECGPNNSYNRRNQPHVSRHQTRFDEGLKRQYSPNYINYHQSPLGSIPGQDLSATLMELANIQSRSLEMIAASQRSQQQAFHKLTRASKDKANNAMFASIKVFDGQKQTSF